MNKTINLIAYGNKLSSLVEKVRTFFARHPEWLTGVLCLIAWVVIIANSFDTSYGEKPSAHFIYCIKPGTFQQEKFPAYQIENISNYAIFSAVFTTILNGLVHWIIMVAAMMFPLLNEPVKHVAFSVKLKDKYFGILSFLAGYIIVWTVIGILFLLLPFCLDTLVNIQNLFLKALTNASGFLVAAALVWLPSRPFRMTRCSQTAPIGIQGWKLPADCFSYGLKIGLACLSLCWSPMAALILSNHNPALMLIATIVIVYERYLLPHTSKFSGYAWIAIALTLFCMEMYV